ncbi:hypothetical protein FRB90_012200 [Tulasnella sp. 427]|nr:hypothetical protein FRB90_012200 [Tulasnella sp. 427]
MQVNTHAPVEGLTKARRHLLLFASQLCAPVAAHPERIDQAFLGSIDFESMLSIIVACIFEATAAELDQLVISSGCQILSIYGKVRGFGNSIASSTVKKYGARNMAEKCTTIIEFGPASIEKLVQTSALVHCLIFAESFKMEIIVHCGLHLKLMKRWWEAQRATVKKPLTEGLDQTLFFSDLQALIESIPLSSGQAIVIHDLIQQQYLMHVFGLGLVRPDSGLPGILTGTEGTIQNSRGDGLASNW